MPVHGTLTDHARSCPEMVIARFGRSRFPVALYVGQPKVEPSVGLIALERLEAVLGWPLAGDRIAIMLPAIEPAWPAWRIAQRTVQAIFAADDPMICCLARRVNSVVSNLVFSVFGHIARFSARHPDSDYHREFNLLARRAQQTGSVAKHITRPPHVRASAFANDLVAQYLLQGEIAFRRPVLDPPTVVGPQIDRNLLALYRFDPVLSEFVTSALREDMPGRNLKLAARKAELTAIFHEFAARADLLRPTATDRLDDILDRFTDRLNGLCDGLLTSCIGQAVIV